ncbi:hypothetical protein D9Q98_008832 [Chlorella vulgaris]|uniref:RING-type E3 ubiquitin transferase n=1 Tax=Chlorella vulgaris TaxID=3077 RepID=A0A9D4YU95_CHLVU|nr:hypothetical protein D9Q98_008832 [Chlorella vulgaris]
MDQAAPASALVHASSTATDGLDASQVRSKRPPRVRRPRQSQQQQQHPQGAAQQQLEPPAVTAQTAPLTWQQQQMSPGAPPFQPSSRLIGQALQAGGAQRQRERRPRGSRVQQHAGAAAGLELPANELGIVLQPAQAAAAGQQRGDQTDLEQPQMGQQERSAPRQRRQERSPRPQQAQAQHLESQAQQAQQRQPTQQRQRQQQRQRGDGSLSHVVRPAQAAGQQQQQTEQLMEGSAIGQPATSAADRANSGHAAPAGAPEQQLSEHGQLAAAPQAGPKASRSRQRRERQAGQEAAQGAHPEAPHCLVCCSEMREVGIGACNHKQVCGTCTLRLRLCYDRRDCPLCKTELKEVVVAPWRPELPDWADYAAHPEWVARTKRWAGGKICADRWSGGGRRGAPLLQQLQSRTALACMVCDPGGQVPFQRREQLLMHVEQEHGMGLCSLCLGEGRLFPLELQAFASPAALQAHSAAAHPRCEFCRRTFFDDDALWSHMQQVHYSCHVCPPPVAAAAYFNSSQDLLRHMRSDHFMCEEAECVDCFVAFSSVEDLQRHHMERHSARMPRWDSTRARPMHLDITFARRTGSLTAAEVADERQRQRQRPRRTQDVRMQPEGPAQAQQQQQQQQGERASRVEYAREVEGGLSVIDDADIPLGQLPQHAATRNRYAGSIGGGMNGGGGWDGGSRAQMQQSNFPSLQPASSQAGVQAGSAAARDASSSARPPPLVKKTAKCPCGRRVSHFAMEEGQEVPSLECDAVCRLEGRRQKLADAFGVEDPAHHLSAFERNKTATYNGLLLSAAQRHPRFVEGVERQLAEFVVDKQSRRVSLSSMPREQRAVVHAMAEQYGLASTSFGQDPQRYVELFKTPTTGIPARLLSRVAPTVPPEQVAELLREAEGHTLRFTDVAMSVDLSFYLRQWDGQYAVEWQGGDAAVVRFEREQDLKAALDALGGGIRGLFRIDRSWRPKTAVTASGGGASTGTSTANWASGGASASASSADAADGGASTSWTAVAVAPRPALRSEQQQQPQQQQGGGEQQRWAVMTGRRAARPAAIAAAINRHSQASLMMPEEAEDVVTTDDSSSDED